MRRLEDSVFVADVCRRSHAHPTDQPSRQVGKNVTKHVLGYEDVEGCRPLHEIETGSVHVDSVGLHRWKLSSRFVKYLAEERHRRKYVGLVHQSQMLAPRNRLFKCRAKQPL